MVEENANEMTVAEIERLKTERDSYKFALSIAQDDIKYLEARIKDIVGECVQFRNSSRDAIQAIIEKYGLSNG